MRITMKSKASGKTNVMDIPVDSAKLRDWAEGRTQGLIQNVFPELTGEQREFLLTGTTPEEWKELFGDGES